MFSLFFRDDTTSDLPDPETIPNVINIFVFFLFFRKKQNC